MADWWERVSNGFPYGKPLVMWSGQNNTGKTVFVPDDDKNSHVEDYEPPPRELTREEEQELENAGKCL